MAPKLSKEDPPAASSSDEEASSEEEIESSDEESQPSLPPQSQSKKPAPQKPEESFSALKTESEESETESEDSTDSDSKSAAVGKNVKPTASKPMEDAQAKSTKAKAKAAPATPVSKPTAAAGKRAGGETEESKDVKRRKEGGSGENTEDTKKQQRLWSDGDETALLGGMIEFSKDRRVDPTRDLAAFHDFIKKSLSIEVTQSQVKEKIGRLRRKFAKAKEGEASSFSKFHDREVFDLSKKIWGTKSQAEPSNKKAKVFNNGDSSKLAAIKADLGLGNGKEDKMEIEKHEPKGDLSLDWTMGVIEDMGKFVATKGLDYVDVSKRSELEKRWKEVNIASLELLAKRSQLVSDHAKLMLDAMED